MESFDRKGSDCSSSGMEAKQFFFVIRCILSGESGQKFVANEIANPNIEKGKNMKNKST